MSQQITIGHLKQVNKRTMSKPEENYMWGNVDNTIQGIQSLIYIINITTDLYEPKFCSPDNDGCSQRSSHNIGEFMPMREKIVFSLGLSTSVHQFMNIFLNWKISTFK